MKIDIAKEDLWWLREALTHAIRHMESQPNPAAFSKMPHVARKTYKKLSVAMKSWDHDKSYFPNAKGVAAPACTSKNDPTASTESPRPACSRSSESI